MRPVANSGVGPFVQTSILENGATATNIIGAYNAAGTLIASYDVTFIDNGDTGTPPTVPEPTTMLLFGSGLVGLVAYRLRSKKA